LLLRDAAAAARILRMKARPDPRPGMPSLAEPCTPRLRGRKAGENPGRRHRPQGYRLVRDRPSMGAALAVLSIGSRFTAGRCPPQVLRPMFTRMKPNSRHNYFISTRCHLYLP